MGERTNRQTACSRLYSKARPTACWSRQIPGQLNHFDGVRHVMMAPPKAHCANHVQIHHAPKNMYGTPRQLIERVAAA